MSSDDRRGDRGRVVIRTFGELAVSGPDGPIGSILRQPKQFALLTYLALSTREGFCRRDAVVAVFWPESDQERARAALRNALYGLRKALGPDVILSEGDEILRVDPTMLQLDATAFDEALDQGALEGALEQYRGDFLPGFHLNGGSEFDPWQDGLRRGYRRRALAAAITLSERASLDSDVPAEAKWLQRATELAPLDDDPVRRLITLHLQGGNRGAAAASYADFRDRLRHVGLEPARETNDLIGALNPRSAGSVAKAAADQASIIDAQEPQRLDVSRSVEGMPAIARAPGGRSFFRRSYAGTVSAIAIGVLLLSTLIAARWSEQHWARTEGFADFRALVAERDFVGAYALEPRLRPFLNGDTEFEGLWTQATFPTSVSTAPTSAVVYIKEYSRPDDPWIRLGTTPLADVRIPATYLRWRIEAPGVAPVERAAIDAYFRPAIHFDLPDVDAPVGMALVTGDALNVGAPYALPLEPYWLDRAEVSNSAYATFLASPSYDSVVAGLPLMDRSGLPGPSTWVAGTFPPGEAQYPVRGVSWYEADAFCRWAGKELPTVYHWYGAGGYHGYSSILELSNFSAHGPIEVGAGHGTGPYGHADLAGNVREWAANEADGLRYILGGAWDSPRYLYWTPDVAPAEDRSDQNGFRCARSSEPADHIARAGIPLPAARPVVEPVGDDEFARLLAHYVYDAAPLAAVLDSVSDDAPHGRREFVSVRAGYGDEMVQLQLFLPARGRKPRGTVIFHPGAEANHLASASSAHTWWFDFIVRSGFAVVYPTYKGTYERRVPLAGPIDFRNQVVQRVQDVRRTIDYLETRDDIDADRVAFYGFSQGGVIAPIVVAVEDRLAGAVVLSGGLFGAELDPVVEPTNFLGRTNAPLLMLGGEFDFIFPARESQRLFYEGWGDADGDKRFVSLPFGHAPREMGPVAAEIIPWLERQLGS